jgi:cytochrome b subunit of formate dehydrogenase
MASEPPSRLTRFAIFVRETFWVFALGAILAYLFFMVLGAFDPADAAGVSIAVGVLALLWILHAWAGRRRADDRRDPRLIEARERRGF